MGVLVLLFFFAGVIALIVWITRIQIGAFHEDIAERKQAMTQVLQLDPRYQAKIEADRRYTLATRKLDIEEIKARRIDVSVNGTYIYGDMPNLTPLHPFHKPELLPAANGTSSNIALPSAPPFSHIEHLITPERLILNYVASGPVYGQVDDLLSMALVGKPKRGKTTALLYYLCILLKAGAEVWIWDVHGEMAELAYGLHYYSDLEEIAASAAILNDELNERNFIYKTENKRVKHPLVLLVDEMPVLADWEQTQRKLIKEHKRDELPASPYNVLKRFTLEARKWRGFVFISGQSLPADVLPTLTRDNLSSRLVLECSADHARMIGLPKKAVDTLLPVLRGAERGTHIADFSSWSQPELADIPYTTIRDLRGIIDESGNAVSRAETPIQADGRIIHGAFPVSRENHSTSVKATAFVGNDIRETIKRMYRKGMALRDIASLVGLSGRKYSVFQEVCSEEGITVQVESETL